MYKQFTKNMDNYLRLNQGDDDNFRYAIVKELEVLSDVTSYKSLKKIDANRYKKIATLLWAISNRFRSLPIFQSIFVGALGLWV